MNSSFERRQKICCHVFRYHVRRFVVFVNRNMKYVDYDYRNVWWMFALFIISIIIDGSMVCHTTVEKCYPYPTYRPPTRHQSTNRRKKMLISLFCFFFFISEYVPLFNRMRNAFRNDMMCDVSRSLRRIFVHIQLCSHASRINNNKYISHSPFICFVLFPFLPPFLCRRCLPSAGIHWLRPLNLYEMLLFPFFRNLQCDSSA